MVAALIAPADVPQIIGNGLLQPKGNNSAMAFMAPT
jgi:hypothetical protein